MTTPNPALTHATGVASPSFLTLTQGELFKLIRNRGLLITVSLFFLPFLLNIVGTTLTVIAEFSTSEQISSILPNASISPVYVLMQGLLGTTRGFLGVDALIIAVIAIGLEYQQGTIRVLIARGLGRLQVLGAKLTATFIYGLVVLLIMLLFVAGANLLFVIVAPHYNIDTTAPAYFGRDTLIYLGTILISLTITILLASCFAVIGRSLALGLGIALPWFLVENIISGIFTALAVGTKTTWEAYVSDYLLGGALTRLPAFLLSVNTNQGGSSFLRQVLPDYTPPTLTMTIGVLAGWTILFSAGAFLLTWYRDIQN